MGDILARVNEFARDHDITFIVHDSFEGFEDLDIDRGGYGVHPGFTPALSPQGQWIEARMFGKPIATMAAQPIDMADTLTSHLETEAPCISTDAMEANRSGAKFVYVIDRGSGAKCSLIGSTAVISKA